MQAANARYFSSLEGECWQIWCGKLGISTISLERLQQIGDSRDILNYPQQLFNRSIYF